MVLSKIFAILTFISDRFLYSGFIITIFIIVTSWYFLLYLPLRKNIFSLTHQNTTLSKRLDLLIKRTDRLTSCNVDFESTNLVLAKKAENFPLLFRNALERVLKAIKVSGLDVVSCTPQEEKLHEYYSTCCIQYHFKGSYTQLITFLTDIENVSVVLSCEIEKKIHHIQILLVLMLYFRTA